MQEEVDVQRARGEVQAADRVGAADQAAAVENGLATRALQLEAGLLLLLGMLGEFVQTVPVAGLAVPLLCSLMGLQIATVTKISGSRIRTTHMTGVVTDLGIELGKLLYWNRMPGGVAVRADRAKLRLLLAILTGFMLGGVAGAVAFSRLGFVSTVPLALLLVALAGAMIRTEGSASPTGPVRSG
ncbi:YoaK family protein [Roseomonas sp. GCM10028921]